MALCVLCKRRFTLERDLKKHLPNCPARRGHQREHEEDSHLITAGLVGAVVSSLLNDDDDHRSGGFDSGDSFGGGDFGGGGASDSFGD